MFSSLLLLVFLSSSSLSHFFFCVNILILLLPPAMSFLVFYILFPYKFDFLYIDLFKSIYFLKQRVFFFSFFFFFLVGKHACILHRPHRWVTHVSKSGELWLEIITLFEMNESALVAHLSD
jgi:hypothetical protein